MMRLPRRFTSGSSISSAPSAPSASSASVLALVVGGIIGGATLLQGGTAEAGHAHFSGGGHVSGGAHVSGGVRFSGGVHVSGGAHFSGHVGWSSGVHFARPVWHRPWFGGRVWVGTYYRPYYYYPYYYYPEYVPSYYGSAYYPVQPAAAPGVAAVAAPRPSLPTFGIGVFAGGSSVQNVQNKEDTSDLGALARLRLTPGLIVEGEIEKNSFKDNVRVDRRMGGSLIFEIGAHNTFAPYLLAGVGVQQANVDSSFTTTQDYGEIGVGLRWALSRNLHLALDIRAGKSQTIDSNQPPMVSNAARSVAPPVGSNGSNNTEDFTRGRLAAILNF